MDTANPNRLLFRQALVSREIVSTDLHRWSIGASDGGAWRLAKKVPRPGSLTVRDTRNLTTAHAFPARDILFMVYRHRGHNRGVGPFLSSFTGGQNPFRQKSSRRLTRIANLGILSDGGRFGAPRQTSFVPTMQRRLHDGEEFHGHSTGD